MFTLVSFVVLYRRFGIWIEYVDFELISDLALYAMVLDGEIWGIKLLSRSRLSWTKEIIYRQKL